MRLLAVKGSGEDTVECDVTLYPQLCDPVPGDPRRVILSQGDPVECQFETPLLTDKQQLKEALGMKGEAGCHFLCMAQGLIWEGAPCQGSGSEAGAES